MIRDGRGPAPTGFALQSCEILHGRLVYGASPIRQSSSVNL
jgi:hypothetical protein